MHESKPQHNLLKVTGNATNRVKHVNEAMKQILPTIFSKLPVNTRKVCFPIKEFVSMFLTYELIAKCCLFKK